MAPVQEAAPVQQMLLDLAFPMATFTAGFSESSGILQKQRLHDFPTGQLYQFIGDKAVPCLQTCCLVSLHTLHKEHRHIVRMLLHTDLWGLSPLCGFSPKHHKYSTEVLSCEDTGLDLPL